MLSPDKSIFKLSYADVYTPKRLGNVNFGEKYRHFDVTSKHVETHFKSQRKSQTDASGACPCSAFPRGLVGQSAFLSLVEMVPFSSTVANSKTILSVLLF